MHQHFPRIFIHFALKIHTKVEAILISKQLLVATLVSEFDINWTSVSFLKATILTVLKNTYYLLDSNKNGPPNYHLIIKRVRIEARSSGPYEILS